MPKAEEHELQKHTLNLFKGDFDRLRGIAGEAGAGKIIRRLVRRYINEVDSSVKTKHKKIEVQL